MKKKKPKVFAMYLPQYHEIKENSDFWGEGFTDWAGVRNSRPLFKGHVQPKVPLHHNYYDLSHKESVKWQCETARKYGITGFAIYHYWFNDEKNLLTAPSELILRNRELNIKYFFAWDNISWVRSWTGIKGNDWYLAGESGKENRDPAVLVEYILGGPKQWENHYRYVRPFFMDERYETHKNKPVFMILNPGREIMEMSRYWNKRAKDDGYAGIHFIYRWNSLHPKINSLLIHKEKFYYEPVYSGWGDLVSKVKAKIVRKNRNGKPQVYSYDRIWRNILKKAKRAAPGGYSGAFVRYDDTPRRGERGKVVRGESPEKFEFYFRELFRISAEKRKRYIFLTAWNEWGEGAFLEPDEKDGYAYLNAVKNVVKES